MIFLLFAAIFTPLVIYESVSIYKKNKKNKKNKLNKGDVNQEYYNHKEPLPWFDLNDSNGYRIEDGQEVFVVHKGIRYLSITYFTAKYVEVTVDTEDHFNLEYLSGPSVAKGQFVVFVADRGWKKQTVSLSGTSNYSNIDQIPFSYDT